MNYIGQGLQGGITEVLTYSLMEEIFCAFESTSRKDEPSALVYHRLGPPNTDDDSVFSLEF